ncbi:MAG TPA: FmdB family zinc ribbon protein [Frankiaceae bacterium]|nr:FmdB family zinc ribbon protein [Frankiaceae bacterium]
MPSYAYRCRTCDSSFDVQRSLRDATATAPVCPAGHTETSRVWSAVAVTGVSSSPAPVAAPAGGGGCCGGGCCG